MKLKKHWTRFFIYWNWTYKWRFGRVPAACGCRIYEFGPLCMEYLGDYCYKEYARQQRKVLKFKRPKKKKS